MSIVYTYHIFFLDELSDNNTQRGRLWGERPANVATATEHRVMGHCCSNILIASFARDNVQSLQQEVQVPSPSSSSLIS